MPPPVRLLRTVKAWLRAMRRVLRRFFLPLVADRPLVEVVLEDFTLLVDPRTDPGWNLLRRGAYEPGKLAALRAVVTGEDVFLDVGASFGFFTLSLAPVTREVVAVEPAPRSCRLLRANIAANGLSNASVVEAALGAEQGTETMRLTGDESFSTLGDTDRDLVRAEREVRMTTLDEVAGDGPAGIPTVVKIDAEGAELGILEGGGDVLRGANAPRLVFVEVDPRNTESFGYGPERVFALMRDRGYQAVDLRGRPVRASTADTRLGAAAEVVFYREGSEEARRSVRELRDGPDPV